MQAVYDDMKLNELIAGLDVQRMDASAGDPVVGAVTEDSRRVEPGTLFLARAGLVSDGRQYVEEAIRRGAVAVVAETPPATPSGVAILIARDVPLVAAQLAERFFGQPSRALSLIGVTGTNGKTTTAHLVKQILDTSGSSCGLIGTVETHDGKSASAASLTTPPAIEISGLLRRMVDNGCRACAMEASSHALLQRRVAALSFRVGIFTNLSGDHLDYHGTMDAYADAKAMLFTALSSDATAIVNADDPHADRMVRDCRANVWRASLTDHGADLLAELHEFTAQGMDATIRGPWGAFRVHLPLVGRHNLMNALQASGAAHALGVSGDALRTALTTAMAPPGRLEPVHETEDGFSVLVDYAHTDDALDNVLRAVRPLVPVGARLIVVFGCGGDRDRSKRPRMANIAAKHADLIVITSDNPRTEDPAAIIREIESGLPTDQRIPSESMVDRRQAIRHAIDLAERGDIIVIAGKGHEDYQILGTTKQPFDDRLVAREALAARRTGAEVA